jgi:hypothetical protein
MKETKIFLSDEENKELIEVAKENGQSKVKYCTVQIKMLLKKSKAGGEKIKQKDLLSTNLATKKGYCTQR